MTLAEQVKVRRSLPSPAVAVALMADAGVTMHAVAIEGDLSPTTVRRYLEGRPVRTRTAQNLSRVLSDLRAVV